MMPVMSAFFILKYPQMVAETYRSNRRMFHIHPTNRAALGFEPLDEMGGDEAAGATDYNVFHRRGRSGVEGAGLNGRG